MEIVDGIRNFFQSLTVFGWLIFVSSLVAFLITSALFLIKRGGDRYAWFLVILVAIFLGIGLRYGIPKATELLSYGIGDSLIWVPKIQESVGDAFDMAVAPWLDGGSGLPQPESTLVITESDVTIIATPGLPPTPSGTPAPQVTPEITPLTNDQIAATQVFNQQLTATFTPRPPTVEPTIDPALWNPQTPPPTPSINGGN